MHHNIFGKKLNRDTGQRQALLKGLAGAMIRSEAIETTETKAQAAVGMIEKLITQARRATLNDVRQIEAVLVHKDLVQKLVHSIAPRFKDRKGGYLRLIKLGNRTGDNAPMVRMEFTAAESVVAAAPSPKAVEAAPKEASVTQEVAAPKAPKAAAKKPAPKKVTKKAAPKE